MNPFLPHRPESVTTATDNRVLQDLIKFHSNQKAFIVDATANRRKMWKGVSHKGRIVFMDIDPSMKPDVVCDFTDMHFLGNSSVDILVWDPPHLPTASASQMALNSMVDAYGLRSSVQGNNISAIFPRFLQEVLRVLKPDGFLFAKLKDFIHNHKYQWTLVDFITAVRKTQGLTACDLRIKRDPCGGNLKSGRWKKVHHARNAHSWWVVVRKGKCEPANKIPLRVKRVI